MLVMAIQRLSVNEKVFIKKGEFENRPPVADAEFYFKVYYFQLLHSITSNGANID